MRINPGELRKKIEVIQRIPQVNKNGFETYIETIVVTAWAKVTNVSGTELIKAGNEFSETKKRFLIRYPNAKIDTDMTVRYEGTQYLIEYLNNYEDSNQYLEIWTKNRS